MLRIAFHDVAQDRGALGHSVDEFKRHAAQRRRGQLERKQTCEGESDIDGDLGLGRHQFAGVALGGVPADGRGHLAANGIDEIAACRRVWDIQEQIAALWKAASIVAQNVALNIAEIEFPGHGRTLVMT
jgi:hypothetical protein